LSGLNEIAQGQQMFHTRIGFMNLAARALAACSSLWKASDAAAGQSDLEILMTQLELLGDGLITADIRIMQIIEQTPALPDHHQQPATRTMVLVVALQVAGQVVNPLGQQRYLDVRRTSVLLVQLELVNRFRFGFHTIKNPAVS